MSFHSGHFAHGRKVTCRDERAGVEMLRGDVPIDVREPQAGIERPVVNGPLILNVETVVGLHDLVLSPRIRPKPERHRRASQVDVRDAVVIEHAAVNVVVDDPLFRLKAGLERVGAGDIREAEALVPAQKLVGTPVAGPRRREWRRVVPEVRRLFQRRDRGAGHSGCCDSGK
jgi:hypothetical protein